MQTNAHTETTIDEMAAGIYRIDTPLRIDAIPGGFTLSHYLIVDNAPMIFHTGWRRWFAFVSEAISKVIPLVHIGYFHSKRNELWRDQRVSGRCTARSSVRQPCRPDDITQRSCRQGGARFG